MRPLRTLLLTAVLLAVGDGALAGAPLKGVDVKLGKNPGGSPAARVTDAAGNADFGVVAAGDYALTVTAPAGAKSLHLVISGASGGPIARDIPAGAAQRTAPVALSVSSPGPLKVSVTEAGPAAD